MFVSITVSSFISPSSVVKLGLYAFQPLNVYPVFSGGVILSAENSVPQSTVNVSMALPPSVSNTIVTVSNTNLAYKFVSPVITSP